MHSLFFFKNLSFTIKTTPKKHTLLRSFRKLAKYWTQFYRKTKVFTTHPFTCFFKKRVFYDTLSPMVKPKVFFVQKHKFLQRIVSNFSKTSVFTMTNEPVAAALWWPAWAVWLVWLAGRSPAPDLGLNSRAKPSWVQKTIKT